MKKFRKLTAAGLTVSAIAAPLVTAISCGADSTKPKNYTVGLACSPVATMNYIKYGSSSSIGGALVESLFKGGPNSNTPISNYLKLDQITVGGGNNVTEMSHGGYQTGVLRRGLHRGAGKENDVAIHASNWTFSSEYTANLNGKSEWLNGEKLTSSNFIDSAVYILDINTGSQRVKELFDLNIRNTREFVNAQNEYAKAMGQSYKNPFGYEYKKLPEDASPKVRSVWTYYQQRSTEFPLQKYKDGTQAEKVKERALIAEIEKTARGLGLYGDEYSSHPHKNESGENILGWKLSSKNKPTDKSEYIVPAKDGAIQPFKLDIKSEIAVQGFQFIVNGLAARSNALIPVNRRFIESTGGIQSFGNDQAHFLTEGPFTIKNAIFGVNGNMVLQKNHKYALAKEIIPETVKLFFQTDPNILGSLFEDGYISATEINSLYTKKFFSNKDLRNLIQKMAGFGMTGFTFNLDKRTNQNPALFNPHFRKALLFAINRNEIIKVSGFDSTLPSYSVIEPEGPLESYMAPSRGVTMGVTHVGETIKYSDSFEAPIISSSTLDTIGTFQLFTHPDQTDLLHNIAEAKKEMALYKKEHPTINKVKIKFVHDSSAMMLNMALALKSEFKEAFGDFVELEIKGYPKSIYDSFTSEGNFDMTWKNMDSLAVSGLPNSIDAFLVKDEIDPKNMKSTGFISNPTGSWTLFDAIQYYEKHNIVAETKQRLRISDQNWNKIKELATLPNIAELTDAKKELLQKTKVDAFFARSGVEPSLLPDSLKTNTHWTEVDRNYDTTHEIVEFVLAANRMVMDQAPVLPAFKVDVITKIDRLPSVNYTRGSTGYGYIYDLARKPFPDLPGMEAKGV